jgi:hypothetical protein
MPALRGAVDPLNGSAAAADARLDHRNRSCAISPGAHLIDIISASSFPVLTTSPTPFPNIERAKGEACEMDPLAGSASSSPTIRKVCSRPSLRTIVTVVPKRTSEMSTGDGRTRALARRELQYRTSRADTALTHDRSKPGQARETFAPPPARPRSGPSLLP